MFKYVVKRLVLAILTIFIILTLTFVLVKSLPFVKPVGSLSEIQAYYNEQIRLGYVVAFDLPVLNYGEMLIELNGKYLYQVPIIDQYFTWLKGIFTSFDWGVSNQISLGDPSMTVVFLKMPVSLTINFISILISIPIGIILGIAAALRKNKPADHFISTGVMIFISIPSFVLISYLLLLFAYTFKVLPSTFPSEDAEISERILGYIIPILALSFGSISTYARFTRAELCDVMNSEYLLLARTKGLSKKQSIKRHALKNAMVPILPTIILTIVSIFTGSIVLESIYSIPGIGDVFIRSLNLKDYDVLFATIAVFTSITILSGVLVDISYGFLDPRIRMGAKSNGAR